MADDLDQAARDRIARLRTTGLGGPAPSPFRAPLLDAEAFEQALRSTAALYGYDARRIIERCRELSVSTVGSYSAWLDRANTIMNDAARRGEAPSSEAIMARLWPTERGAMRRTEVELRLFNAPPLDLSEPALRDEFEGRVVSINGGAIAVVLEFHGSTGAPVHSVTLSTPGFELEGLTLSMVAEMVAGAIDDIEGVRAHASGSQLHVAAHPRLGLRIYTSGPGATILWQQTVVGMTFPPPAAPDVPLLPREPTWTSRPKMQLPRVPQPVQERGEPTRSIGLLSLTAKSKLYPGLRSVPERLRGDVLALVSIHGLEHERLGKPLAEMLGVSPTIYVVSGLYPVAALARRLINRARHDGVLSRRGRLTPPHRWRRSASYPWPRASLFGNAELPQSVLEA